MSSDVKVQIAQTFSFDNKPNKCFIPKFISFINQPYQNEYVCPTHDVMNNYASKRQPLNDFKIQLPFYQNVQAFDTLFIRHF